MDNFYILAMVDVESGNFKLVKYPKDDYDICNVFVEAYNDVNDSHFNIVSKFSVKEVLDSNDGFLEDIQALLNEIENSGQPIVETSKFQFAIRGMREFWS